MLLRPLPELDFSIYQVDCFDIGVTAKFKESEVALSFKPLKNKAFLRSDCKKSTASSGGTE
jgi:hypothetical protein